VPTKIFSRGDRLEDGHYTVLEEIGVGGMGVVYHCRDELLLRDVALKMLLPSLMADKKNVEVFREEARMAAQLDHPNIVTVFDVGTEMRNSREHHFVAMEYLPGGNLAARVSQGPLPIEHCLNWMKQLAAGLSFAHKRGVIHQDIKADNIFITNEGDLKIGDFGLARLLVGRVYLNSATKGMGTPAYMSPELCRGEQQDHRSDIYSMGILFFEMCTGQLPYRAQGMIEMAMKHTNAPVPSPRKLNSEIPDVLDRVVKRMMAKQPDERFKSMTDVLGIIDDLIFELRVARMGLSPRTTIRPQIPQIPVVEPQAKPQTAEEIKNRDQPPKSEKSEKSGPTFRTTGVASPGRQGSGQSTPAKNPPVPPAPTSSTVPPTAAKSDTASSTSLAAAGKASNQNPTSSTSTSGQIAPERISQGRQDKTPVRLNVLTATAIWTYATRGPIGWSAAPVMSRDEKQIYIGSTDGRLYGLDRESGQEVQRIDVDAPILNSPVLTADRIIVSDGSGKTQAFDKVSGKLQWSWEGNAAVVASPVLSGNHVIVCDKQGLVVALDQRLGRKIWTFNAADAIVAAPRMHGDSLYFGTRGGHVYSLSNSNGKLNWKFTADGRLLSTPQASVDTVYLGTQAGIFFALDAEGGRLIWEYSINNAIVRSGVIVFTSVLFAGEDKWLYCCEKYAGTLKWKAALKGIPAAPLETSGTLVVALSKDGWLQVFDLASGTCKSQSFLHKSVESPPLIAGGKIYVGTIEGQLICYELPK
jgi:serine/threonine protein kinase